MSEPKVGDRIKVKTVVEFEGTLTKIWKEYDQGESYSYTYGVSTEGGGYREVDLGDPSAVTTITPIEMYVYE